MNADSISNKKITARIVGNTANAEEAKKITY